MEVKMSARTATTLVGTGAGGLSAAAIASKAANVTIYYLHLDPATPADIVSDIGTLTACVYGLVITGLIGWLTYLVSPKRKETNNAQLPGA